MKQAFEQYLEEVHSKGYTGTDDDMPDAFEAWVGNLDSQEIIDLADVYGLEQYELGCLHTANEANKLSTNIN